MIELSKIGVTFSPNTVNEKKALKGISLAIDEGEFISLIGSNGAGKSTLLNVIAGEILPNSGTIKICGKDVTPLKPHQRSSWVARVFQDPLIGSCGDLTVAENLALASKRGTSRGLSSGLTQAMKAEFKESLASLNLDLATRLDTPMKLLSGGQRQAISLLMATWSPLKILLLDEHTAALDPRTAASIMELTQRIVKEKKITVLMVTHSLQYALQYGTRTVMLHEGQVLCDLSTEKRQGLTVQDLLSKFGTTIDDDKILLGAN
jgi:putative ABC transport system ATP-binding protein